MTQYLRRVIATFKGDSGSYRVTDLKISFEVSKTITGTPNAAEISIWNMAGGNRSRIGKEFDRVTLQAGYEKAGNIGIIFDGHVREVTHSRDDTDIVTKIECGDGDKAKRKGVIAKTFPAKTKPKDMVKEILKNMPDVAQGEWKGLDDLPEYKRPVTMCGPCWRELDKIGRSHKLFWSVQDGALEIIPKDGNLQDEVLISKATGMVGVPSVTDAGIKVTTLLNPQLRCNRLVKVESQILELNGKGQRYRISGLSFSGDNRDGDFHAVVQGETVKGASEGTKKGGK
ncbi:hypothetical protein PMNALOAF_1267 [Methylobacterium adhaesivum]|uniref:Uncharacterized protein n=1 Tax=Methylobacterium adhaesivum TaxID=333297 RepID=A0ABT8BFQ4_9HYPH|nr:hypothetical protein [Methylobacterium adhaesivum]MDN3590590.1 hypothetical protein [Methylobacterium adhaesivum]GJD30024.1 hypothetical protein PMNALOAF_1267 [Methylobacterium adhaesivum]